MCGSSHPSFEYHFWWRVVHTTSYYRVDRSVSGIENLRKLGQSLMFHVGSHQMTLIGALQHSRFFSWFFVQATINSFSSCVLSHSESSQRTIMAKKRNPPTKTTSVKGEVFETRMGRLSISRGSDSRLHLSILFKRHATNRISILSFNSATLHNKQKKNPPCPLQSAGLWVLHLPPHLPPVASFMRQGLRGIRFTLVGERSCQRTIKDCSSHLVLYSR